MSRLRSGAVAALLITLALPISAHAGTAGSSCAHPAFWHLRATEVAQVAGPPTGKVTIDHGPMKLTSDRGNPFAVGPLVKVSGTGALRICSVRGSYANGHSFFVPGTIGTATHPSMATRWFMSSGQFAPAQILVAYAPRGRDDGRTCAHPAVVFADTPSSDGLGDLGARIRPKLEYDGNGSARTRAEWQTAAHSQTCAVHGWDRRGHAFTLHSPRDGSHLMSQFAVVGNHDTPLVYLWIEFTRSG